MLKKNLKCMEISMSGYRKTKRVGRPTGSFKNKRKKVPYSIKIDPDLLDKLRGNDLAAAEVIDRALRDWFAT